MLSFLKKILTEETVSNFITLDGYCFMDSSSGGSRGARDVPPTHFCFLFVCLFLLFFFSFYAVFGEIMQNDRLTSPLP